MEQIDVIKKIEEVSKKLQTRLRQQFNKNVNFEFVYSFVAVVACMVISLFICAIINLFPQKEMLKDNGIVRPSTPEILKLQVFLEGKKNPQDFNIDVEPRKYTKEEIEQNFKKVKEEINQLILGENESLESVNKDLNLTSYIQPYDISIEWYSSDYEHINFDGNVNASDVGAEGKGVELTAKLTCQDMKEEIKVQIILVPPFYSDEEKENKMVEDAINDAFKEGENFEVVQLPTKINGKSISYVEKKDNKTMTIFLMGIIAAAGLIVGRRGNEKNKENERIKQLKFEYPELVSKLTLLIGAGMTVQKAWARIVGDYKNKKDAGQMQVKYAYEEMMFTYNQILSGVPEGIAYIEFGRRCGLKEYRKLGTLLEQNLRKGTKGLALLLEQESAESFEQRKNYAKQLGEEAGTKLLLPMILMLLIVMVIVMVPAIMSFQI